jgi:hypothetical protein
MERIAKVGKFVIEQTKSHVVTMTPGYNRMAIGGKYYYNHSVVNPCHCERAATIEFFYYARIAKHYTIEELFVKLQLSSNELYNKFQRMFARRHGGKWRGYQYQNGKLKFILK